MRMRRAVAFFLHAPGLRFVYDERLTPALARANLLAITATVGCVFIAYRAAPEPERVLWAIGAFVAGHFLWGAYLALRLPPPTDDSPT